MKKWQAEEEKHFAREGQVWDSSLLLQTPTAWTVPFTHTHTHNLTQTHTNSQYSLTHTIHSYTITQHLNTCTRTHTHARTMEVKGKGGRGGSYSHPNTNKAGLRPLPSPAGAWLASPFPLSTLLVQWPAALLPLPAQEKFCSCHLVRIASLLLVPGVQQEGKAGHMGSLSSPSGNRVVAYRKRTSDFSEGVFFLGGRVW